MTPQKLRIIQTTGQDTTSSMSSETTSIPELSAEEPRYPLDTGRYQIISLLLYVRKGKCDIGITLCKLLTTCIYNLAHVINFL